jgi:hypothetical protein
MSYISFSVPFDFQKKSNALHIPTYQLHALQECLYLWLNMYLSTCIGRRILDCRCTPPTAGTYHALKPSDCKQTGLEWILSPTTNKQTPVHSIMEHSDCQHCLEYLFQAELEWKSPPAGHWFKTLLPTAPDLQQFLLKKFFCATGFDKVADFSHCVQMLCDKSSKNEKAPLSSKSKVIRCAHSEVWVSAAIILWHPPLHCMARTQAPCSLLQRPRWTPSCVEVTWSGELSKGVGSCLTLTEKPALVCRAGFNNCKTRKLNKVLKVRCTKKQSEQKPKGQDFWDSKQTTYSPILPVVKYFKLHN